MKRIYKPLALILCLALSFTPCLSARAGGLGDFLAYFTDVNRDVRFSAGASVASIMPFGEDTTAMLNAVLKHIAIDAEVEMVEGGGSSALGLSVDGESMLTLTETQADGGSELVSSLLPNRTLVSGGSAMDALFGTSGDEPAFDALSAIVEVQDCYKALTDAIMPYAEEKKANYKIKGIGSARWSRVARLTEEQSAELAPLMAAVLSSGMDAAYRDQLAQMTYGKGFVVALYRAAADGKDMAVYMKGNVTFADGTARKLDYQWAFIDDGASREDTYKFELKKSKSPSDNRLIAASYEQMSIANRLSVSGKCETTLKTPEQTVATTVKHELEGGESGSARTLTGALSTAVKTTIDGDSETVTTTLTPELRLTSAQGTGVLSGTVRVQKLNGKKTLTDLTIVLDEEPAKRLSAAAGSGELFSVGDEEVIVTIIDPDSIEPEIAEAPASDADIAASQFEVGKPPLGYAAHAVPDAPQTVQLDGATDAQLGALRDEMAQSLASKLLLKLVTLPEEDRTLLSDGMTDEDFAAFMSLIEGL